MNDGLFPVSLEEQIRCVLREIDMRERSYPRWIAEKKLTEAKARHELAAMRAVLATLQSMKEQSNAGA